MKQVLDPAAQWGCDMCGRVQLGRDSSAVFQFSMSVNVVPNVWSFSLLFMGPRVDPGLSLRIFRIHPTSVNSPLSYPRSGFNCLCVKLALNKIASLMYLNIVKIYLVNYVRWLFLLSTNISISIYLWKLLS